ncbi:MAG: YfiT family bacillithiol transferase [Bacteroidota bacterium]
MQNLEQLRYPIGKFLVPEEITAKMEADWISGLEEYPGRLSSLVSHLTNEQLETPYRPNGWTVRQVIHHVSDSHHNSYIRFKWALTENRPVIKAYDEKGWAELMDTRIAPIQLSLDHLSAVHAKLVYLLRRLSPKDLDREFVHPDGNMPTNLRENIGRYVWHGNHHYAHIYNLLSRKGWLAQG